MTITAGMRIKNSKRRKSLLPFSWASSFAAHRVGYRHRAGRVRRVIRLAPGVKLLFEKNSFGGAQAATCPSKKGRTMGEEAQNSISWETRKRAFPSFARPSKSLAMLSLSGVHPFFGLVQKEDLGVAKGAWQRRPAAAPPLKS
jgi:hypothetical protein